MKLFLVTGIIRHIPYMNETHDEKVLRLVKADDENEAEQKFAAAFNKDDPYGLTTYATMIEVLPTIE